MPLEGVFEEKIEFLTVTDFRKALLGIVDRLPKSKYLRYVITKHGEPRAVVMSYEGYELIKNALKQVAVSRGRRERGEALHEAFDRMAEKHWPEVKGESRRMSAATPHLSIVDLASTLKMDLEKFLERSQEVGKERDSRTGERPMARR